MPACHDHTSGRRAVVLQVDGRLYRSMVLAPNDPPLTRAPESQARGVAKRRVAGTALTDGLSADEVFSIRGATNEERP